MKKKLLVLLGVLIIAGGAGGVCWKMGIIGGSADSGESAFVTQISSINGDVSGVTNRYAGVVEAQQTVEVSIESGREVSELDVEVGDEVKAGQLLFTYDLSSIQDSLEEAQLELDQLVNEASSLTQQISALEKEKTTVSSDNQLSYTIEIETAKMNLKKNEYNQKSKQSEIDKLQAATGNTEVRSSIDGVIQKIDTSKMTSTSDTSTTTDTSYSNGAESTGTAFITILSTGAYRVKGTVNELNASSIIAGEPVIIRSRADETQTWKGTMGSIDTENSSTSSSTSSSYGIVDTSGDSQTSSSTYPFYVTLESSDGLMLGQHVYIEMDEGQEEAKAGLWLSEVYICDLDTENPYVWARNDDKKLEKRSVILGQYDEDLGEYEIADGLTKNDYIAFPSDLLKEGMSTTTDSSQAIDMDTSVDSGEDVTTEEYDVDLYSSDDPDTGMVDDGISEEDMEMADEEMANMTTDETMDAEMDATVDADMDATVDGSMDIDAAE